jgi:hypothetical protein
MLPHCQKPLCCLAMLQRNSFVFATLPHVFFVVNSLAKAIWPSCQEPLVCLATWFLVYATFSSIIFATCSLPKHMIFCKCSPNWIKPNKFSSKPILKKKEKYYDLRLILALKGKTTEFDQLLSYFETCSKNSFFKKISQVIYLNASISFITNYNEILFW